MDIGAQAESRELELPCVSCLNCDSCTHRPHFAANPNVSSLSGSLPRGEILSCFCLCDFLPLFVASPSLWQGCLHQQEGCFFFSLPLAVKQLLLHLLQCLHSCLGLGLMLLRSEEQSCLFVGGIGIAADSFGMDEVCHLREWHGRRRRLIGHKLLCVLLAHV